MKQKGMTYIEMMVMLVIMGIITVSIKGYVANLQRIQFNETVGTIENSIKTAQQLAYYQHGTYRIGQYKGTIYMNDTVEIKYKVIIPKHIEVIVGTKDEDHNKTREMVFSESLAPSQCGTITLRSKAINKCAQITVRPVTGKTAVYIEQY